MKKKAFRRLHFVLELLGAVMLLANGCATAIQPGSDQDVESGRDMVEASVADAPLDSDAVADGSDVAACDSELIHGDLDGVTVPDDAVVWQGPDTFDFVLPDLPDETFLTPEGIIISNDRVFVASANFAYSGSELAFGAGFVTVLDARSLQVVNRIPLPFSNPQEIAIARNRLWVLCSGQTYWDSVREMVVPKSGAGLVAVDLETADVATGPSAVIPIEIVHGSLLGYPSGMFLDGDVGWLASGTTAAVFKVDLARGLVIRGSDNPIVQGDQDEQNTLVIGAGPDGLILEALFDSDTVFLVDPDTGEKLNSPWPEAQIGSPGQIDGILDVAHDPATRKVYLLLGLANKVVGFDADKGPSAGVDTVISGVATPNRMKLFNNELFVVNSLGNSVSSVNLATGEIDKVRVALPVNCNPWDLDVNRVYSAENSTSFAFVTCLKLNSVVAVNLESGDSQEIR